MFPEDECPKIAFTGLAYTDLSIKFTNRPIFLRTLSGVFVLQYSKDIFREILHLQEESKLSWPKAMLLRGDINQYVGGLMLADRCLLQLHIRASISNGDSVTMMT